RHKMCLRLWHGQHEATEHRPRQHPQGRTMSWIDQLIQHLEQVTCSGCGEYYRGGDIAAVVTEPSRLIVRLRCRSCGQDGIASLDFGTNTVAANPITSTTSSTRMTCSRSRSIRRSISSPR